LIKIFVKGGGIMIIVIAGMFIGLMIFGVVYALIKDKGDK